MNSNRVLRRSFAMAWLAALCGCALHTPSAVNLKPATLPAPPDLRSSQEILFLVLGDTGRGNQVQEQAGKLMAEVCSSRRPSGGCDFALVAGDLIYDNGVAGVKDEKFSTFFQIPFRDLNENMPMWSVPGNHDWHTAGSVQAMVDYGMKEKRWRMPFNHFEVPALPHWLHIYGVDTAIFDDLRKARGQDLTNLQGLRDEQVKAARQALCGKEGWRFLFGHHPIYSSGQHGRDYGRNGESTQILDTLGPVIQTCKVQAFFAGHDHMQQHLVAQPPAPPFHQIIQGAVAEIRTNDRPFSLPGVESKRLEHKYGFALVTLTPASAKVEFFGFAGKSGPTGNEHEAFYSFSMTP